MFARPILTTTLLATMLAASSSSPPPARTDCSGMSPTLGNVSWGFDDSLSACPAGDSVYAGHPARLRVSVIYEDDNCNAKVHVPPESIWVTTQHLSGFGNLVVNDQGPYIYADDSTDTGGFARVTIPSFSGCGKLRIRLYVSGVNEGYRDLIARTTDPDADGRTESNEYPCDLNYDGQDGTVPDLQIQSAHVPDWHRNVLFGSPVRRTNFCPTCAPGTPNIAGAGIFSWSPTGKALALSARNSDNGCAVYLVPPDPSTGNQLTPFSHPSPGSEDYDPAWSPTGDFIVYDRNDYDLCSKGVPGHNPDTTEHVVPLNSSLPFRTEISISPDGKTIAFAGYDNSGVAAIYTVPVSGGAPTPLTLSDPAHSDHYPHWRPDGTIITFYRGVPHDFLIYEVPAGGGAAREVAGPQNAQFPAYSPDGAILVTAAGAPRVTVTLDTTLASVPRPISNFPEYYGFFIPSPRISPDGTRFGVLAPPPSARDENAQLWVTRRNMNQPPQFTAAGGQSLADSDAVVPIEILVDRDFSMTVAATDTESDALAYQAFYLQLGMTFDPSTRTFSWHPPAGTAGNTYNIKFLVGTASGGTDAFIAELSVVSRLAGEATRDKARPQDAFEVRASGGCFEFGTPYIPGARATLTIFDLQGRLVSRTDDRAGARLVWNPNRRVSRSVPQGIYMYRVVVPGSEKTGKLVFVR